MTDNEIIGIMKNCSDCICYEDCAYKRYGIYCREHLMENALDVINRQQAEIDRLKTEKDNLIKTYAECQIDFLMNFVRKLKCGVPQETGVIRCADIDNLVKEMVGAE